MTNDPLYHQLRESSWRRKLTDAEEAQLRARLAAHPEAQADWEAEAELNEALGRVPEVPVPSNFTARVLQAVERENAAQARGHELNWRRWLRGWLPKAALAAILLVAALFFVGRSHHAAAPELGKILTAVSVGKSPAGPEALQDFDTVRAYTISAGPDEELLAVLK
jgi:anti-sigma factor RsiW